MDDGQVTPTDEGLVTEIVESQWNDTRHDVADMKRLGKKQEFNRNFNFLATLGFVSIYMATWEYVLVYVFVNKPFHWRMEPAGD